MSTSALVYSTTTGDTPRVHADPVGASFSAAFDVVEVDPEPFCFVCSRPTDHFAEHDGLVEAGLACTTGDGSVHKTDAWDDELARKVTEAEYVAYCADLGLDTDPTEED